MHLDARGHPLHTRALSVVLVRRADSRLDVRGSLIDLRKRGFVPVAGDLQGSGVIHDMRLAGVVDPIAGTLVSITAEQPAVAFEPTALTGGESCRDPIRAVDGLAGVRLDAGFASQAGAVLGGPRGCSHILTLTHLLGSACTWALARDRGLHGASAPRRAGERIFRRDVVIDGFEPGDGLVELTVQLTDLHFAPAPALARPMDRFGEQLEVRALAQVEVPSFVLAHLVAAERRRSAADLKSAGWRERGGPAASLAGLRLAAGGTAELIRRLGSAPDDRPLLDALLMLAPTLVQCAAALSDQWPAAFRTDPSLVAMGGLPDSCYMWRRDGALDRTRAAEGRTLPVRGER
jgi:hypothetical protein